MKSVKYTLAALAVIAMASLSTAKAAPDGSVILGVYNSTNSLEFDLGLFNTITVGESWDLGNVSSLAGSGLQFSFSAAATSLAGEGGLASGHIALGGINLSAPGSAVGGEESAINTVAANFGTGTAETPVAGQTYTEELLSSSAAGAYALEAGDQGFGLGVEIAPTWTGNDTVEFATLGNGTLTVDGQFVTTTVGGDTILTFEAISAPEPSAYALGLCALALFWVLKRRSSSTVA